MTSTDGNVVTALLQHRRGHLAPDHHVERHGRAARPDRHHGAQGGPARPGQHGAGAADNHRREVRLLHHHAGRHRRAVQPPRVPRRGVRRATHWARTGATVRPSGNLTVSGGSVKIPIEATDLYQTTNTARDLVLTDLPDGPFVATTKVTAPINGSYQSAGLLVYGDDDNYLKHVFQGRSTDPNAASNIIQTAKEITGTAAETNTPGLGATFPSTVWLRLTSRTASRSSAAYSTDGETWTDMPAGYEPRRHHQPADRPAGRRQHRQVGPASPPASTSSRWARTRRASRVAGSRATPRHRRRRSPSRRPPAGRLVHHAAVVHPGCHRRDGRVGRRLDRVPDRRRRLDAVHRGGLRDR